MSDTPAQAALIKQAFESIGMKRVEVEVSDYSPEFFGNLLATVTTDRGRMEIAYDRQWEIISAPNLDSSTKTAIVEALTARRR